MKQRTAIAILCFLVASVSHATVWNLSASLTGANENPPNASLATGSFLATLDDITGNLNGTISYANLTAGATASHIHGPATAAQNGPVMVPLPLNPLGLTSGSNSFSFVLTSTQVQTVLDGLTYVNVHDSVFPGGEIRGQILATSSVPGPMAVIPFAGGLLVAFKKRRRR